MSKKMYAYVGNWSFEANPKKGKGISCFEYNDSDGGMTLIETIRPDVAAGQLCLDSEKLILYAVNECGERREEIGGGGYIMAFKIDPQTGRLSFLNEKPSLSPEPSYLCLDKSKKYIITCHCADPFHVTKIKQNVDGSFSNEVLFDDTALVMFRLEEDGSLGEICDISLTEGTGGKDPRSQVNQDPVSGHIQLVEVISRLHSVVASPSGEIIAVCDKGMDRIYTYRIDRTAGKLIYLDKWISDQVACFPRYCAFHPTLPVLYANNENHASLNTFHYDAQTGKLVLIDHKFLLPEDPGMVDGKPVGAQDILIHPNGMILYCTLCGLDLIVVCSLDSNGIPSVKQTIHSNGKLPRGICLNPDHTYLFSGNMLSGDITSFKVKEDGTLTSTNKIYDAVSPSAIRILSL